MTGMGQIRPWWSTGVDGGLSSDSRHPGGMPVTEELAISCRTEIASVLTATFKLLFAS